MTGKETCLEDAHRGQRAGRQVGSHSVHLSVQPWLSNRRLLVTMTWDQQGVHQQPACHCPLVLHFLRLSAVGNTENCLGSGDTGSKPASTSRCPLATGWGRQQEGMLQEVLCGAFWKGNVTQQRKARTVLPWQYRKCFHSVRKQHPTLLTCTSLCQGLCGLLGSQACACRPQGSGAPSTAQSALQTPAPLGDTRTLPWGDQSCCGGGQHAATAFCWALVPVAWNIPATVLPEVRQLWDLCQILSFAPNYTLMSD